MENRFQAGGPSPNQVAASHARQAVIRNFHEPVTPACFSFQPLRKRRLGVTVLVRGPIMTCWVGVEQQIMCVFSSQAFTPRRPTLEEPYKTTPEVPFLHLNLDFELMFLWDETYSFGEEEVSVYCMWEERYVNCVGQRMLGRLCFPMMATPTYTVSHVLPKRWCWHVSIERWDLCSLHLNLGGTFPTGWKSMLHDVQGWVRMQCSTHCPHQDACLWNLVTMCWGIPGHGKRPYVVWPLSSPSRAPDYSQH